MLGKVSILLMSALVAHAAETGSTAVSIESGLRQELGKRYAGARIELTAPIQWLRRAGANAVEPDENARVVAITEGARGDLRLTVVDENGKYFEGNSQFKALQTVWVASRRIFPGERLTPELFSVQDVDVAHGMARDYRGVILSPANFRQVDFTGAEARQTVLEGQFLSSTAVQRSPDIRRGDAVKIMIQSGDLQLSTSGTAQEAGYVNGQVRVMTNKTKRELLGSLKPGGLVEVRL